MKYYFLVLALAILSCADESKQKEIAEPNDGITDKEDYDFYLKGNSNENKAKAEKNIEFWSERIKPDSSQIVALGKSAGAYTALFDAEGDVENLLKAETNLKKALDNAAIGRAGYLRALARNYISQHRFKEALDLLIKAEEDGEDLKATQKMLFDVHLELGNTDKAKSYLEEVANMSDFDYLIRLAKWQDHEGDLDSAIKYMEKAMEKAESSNLPAKKQWVYTNVADFYGHAGRIEDSYNYYLKALEIDPEDAYAKKGIAWIVYSYEKNPDEAMRILNSVSDQHKSPDYHLLKSEIAEFQENSELSKKELAYYSNAIENKAYGDMYNKYKILLLADDESQRERAITMAEEEIKKRATAQAYDLLAWAHFKNGNIDKAEEIVDTHVINKTYEPEAMYHVAEIYKAAGRKDEVKPIKKDLQESLYELGPTMEAKINRL